MFDLILSDLSQALTLTVQRLGTGDIIICVIISLWLGLTLGTLGRVFGRALQACLLFGLWAAIGGILLSPDRLRLHAWEAGLVAGWTDLLSLTARNLLGLYLVFFIALIVVHMIKRLAIR